jgi:hypothetical protein
MNKSKIMIEKNIEKEKYFLQIYRVSFIHSFVKYFDLFGGCLLSYGLKLLLEFDYTFEIF